MILCFYNFLRLPQVYSLILIGVLFLVSEIIEILILYSRDLTQAGISVMIALLISNTGLSIFLVFLESLRSPRISTAFLSLIISMPVLKFITLVMEPVKLQFINSFIIRRLAVTPLNLIPTLILVLILITQVTSLSIISIKNKKKRGFLKWMAFCWLFPMSLTLIAYFIAVYILNELLLTYLQYLFTSLGLFFTSLFVSNRKLELFAMPIDLMGIVVSTKTGVLILKEVYDEVRSSAIDFASAIISMILMMGEQVDIRVGDKEITKIEYPEITYLIYSTENLVSSLILNGDNLFIRSILKNFGNELEARVGQTESIITDYEIGVARELIKKYFSFIK